LFRLARPHAQSLSTVKGELCKTAKYKHNIEIYTEKITNSCSPYKNHYPKIDESKK
jgi:hypothetical protein